MEEEEKELGRAELKQIGDDIESIFPYKSLDIQMMIDKVLDLEMMENEKLQMFDLTCFIHHRLVYILQDTCQTFSLITDHCVFPLVVESNSFLEDQLKFSID